MAPEWSYVTRVTKTIELQPTAESMRSVELPLHYNKISVQQIVLLDCKFFITTGEMVKRGELSAIRVAFSATRSTLVCQILGVRMVCRFRITPL